MTEHSGYLFTDDPEVALDMCGEGGVRYAAHLSDGRGFAAFDTDLEGLYHLGTLGRVLTVAEPDPNVPDSWPDWARPSAPHKKFESTMSDTFVLYAMPTRRISARRAFEEFVRANDPKAAALVRDAAMDEFYIFIEDGPDWSCDLDPIWSCGVVDYRDARVLTNG